MRILQQNVVKVAVECVAFGEPEKFHSTNSTSAASTAFVLQFKLRLNLTMEPFSDHPLDPSAKSYPTTRNLRHEPLVSVGSTLYDTLLVIHSFVFTL